MKFLLLFLVLPIGVAEARSKRAEMPTNVYLSRPAENLQAVEIRLPEGATGAATATLKSDSATETVTLQETDAWLHGDASLSKLPATDSALTLTVYDASSLVLVSYSGTLTADGRVLLTADKTSSGCTTRSGCPEESPVELDVELLASETFRSSTGFDLSVDFVGADTYSIAYAKMTVVETVAGSCTTGSKTCTSKQVITSAEVGWSAIGAVWQGTLSEEHTGLVESEIQTYGLDGKKQSNFKTNLGAPWLDGGTGVSTLATDEDPLTRVSVQRDGWSNHAWGSAVDFLVSSEGWTSEAPTHAQVTLSSGSTVLIPATSYQRKLNPPRESESQILFEMIDPSGKLAIVIGNSTFDVSGGSLTFADYSSPVCTSSTCVVLRPSGDTYELAITALASKMAALPTETDITFKASDAYGNPLGSATIHATFETETTVIFANELSFSDDPVGEVMAGAVSLLGAPDKKGKQKTLAKGNFYGSISRDGDGDLGLTGIDRSDAELEPSFAVLFGGPSSTNGEGPPCVFWSVFGNGSGTKAASSQVSAKPELL